MPLPHSVPKELDAEPTTQVKSVLWKAWVCGYQHSRLSEWSNRAPISPLVAGCEILTQLETELLKLLL